MVTFWRQTLKEYAMTVEFNFALRVDDLVEKFTLHNRIPGGLPAIMKLL